MAITGKTAAIAEALRFHLGEKAFDPVLPIAWEGMKYTPTTGETYLAPSVLPNRTDLGAVGANAPRRFLGLFQVVVCGPMHGSPTTLEDIADELIEHFRNALIERNSVRVRVGSFNRSPSLPWQSPAIIDNGWRRVPVTVPWWSDVF